MKIPKLPATPPTPSTHLLNGVQVVNGVQHHADECVLVKGTGTALLHSGGLGPCIATTFYDPVTRTGYMHHEICFALLNKMYLPEIVGVVFHDYGDLSRLSVSVYGCSLFDTDDHEERQYSLQSRALVEGILTFYFGSQQLDIQWSPPNSVGELFLDVETGEVTREFDLLSDLMEE